jgi:hypothetical protein
MGGVGSGAKPRDYPDELVSSIASMYSAGMTIREIQAQTTGAKVQNVIRRYGIRTRTCAKRDQRGPQNHMWKGPAASYAALHLRVVAERGTPSLCEWCGRSDDTRYEWANVTGAYDDPTDYARLCVSCHRTYDARRRALTGRKTTDGWR